MYNSYTSISYKSAAADLHRNLKPLQRMALLSRGFRLYHLHIVNAPIRSEQMHVIVWIG